MTEAAGERAATVDRLLDDYAAFLPRRPTMRGTGTLSPAVAKEELHDARAATMKAALDEKIGREWWMSPFAYVGPIPRARC